MENSVDIIDDNLDEKGDINLEKKTIQISVPKGKWCTSSMAWSRYPCCNHFNRDFKTCNIFNESLDYDYIPSDNPEVEGNRMLKCKQCQETTKHGDYSLLVENIWQYLWIFGKEGGATVKAFKNCLELVDPQKLAELDD